MRRIFALIAALAFVAVQAADLALLDAAHADEAAHAGGLPDTGAPEPCGGDSEADCAWHCPCHILHHAFAQAAPATIGGGAYCGAGLTSGHEFGVGLACRPPVPPPLA